MQTTNFKVNVMIPCSLPWQQAELSATFPSQHCLSQVSYQRTHGFQALHHVTVDIVTLLSTAALHLSTTWGWYPITKFLPIYLWIENGWCTTRSPVSVILPISHMFKPNTSQHCSNGPAWPKIWCCPRAFYTTKSGPPRLQKGTDPEHKNNFNWKLNKAGMVHIQSVKLNQK